VKLRDRVLRIGVAAHGHECKAAGFPRKFILDKHDLRNRPGLGKKVLEIGLRRVEREIAHVEFVTHVMLFQFA
jgi:hypothetical protein